MQIYGIKYKNNLIPSQILYGVNKISKFGNEIIIIKQTFMR